MRFTAVVLLMALPASLTAQAVGGKVTRGGVAIEGAVVAFLDNAGRELARAVSLGEGRYSLRTAPGHYFIRVAQIGFRPTTIGPIELHGGATVSLDIALTSPPLSLTAIVVRDKSACAVRPDSSQPAFAVWEAARSALLATSVTRSEPFDVRLTRHERMLTPDSRSVIADSASTQAGRSLNPVRSLAPAALAASGYLTTDASGERSLWAPDADVLLSDEFLASHCLSVESSESVDASLIGVRFEPARRRRDVVEVEGVLCVDRRSAELRSLEYRYVYGSDLLARSEAGGTVDFLRMGRGRWFVSRWSIRQPVLRERVEGQGNVMPRARSSARTREELAGIKISSGSLLDVSRNGLRLWERGRVSLLVRVLDSATGAPRHRVLVGVDNSGESSSTDSLGLVRLDLVPPGTHALRIEDPELRAIGIAPVLRQVEVPEFNDAEVQLRVAGVRSLLVAQCGQRSLVWGEGMLYGRVAMATRDSSSKVVVVASTPYRQLGAGPITIETLYEVAPARDGTFRVCGLPRDATLRVRKSSDEAGSGVIVRFEPSGVVASVSLP